MPLYELECTKCGKKEEKLFTSIVNFITPRQAKQRRRKERKEVEKASPGYTVIHRNSSGPKPHQPKCTVCGGDQILLYSKVAMQPDKYWSGQVVHGKYVTSKKQIDRDIEPATRDRVEYVRKRKRERDKELAEKASNNLKRYLTESLADVTIESDGNTVAERRKYERKRTTSTD